MDEQGPTIILMCAGKAERWGNYLDVPKHLINIEDETLIQRTVRLLKKKLKKSKIYIVAFDKRYEVEGTKRFEPKHGPINFCDTDKFLSSQELWSKKDRTIVLYGDVYFTENCVNIITSYDKKSYMFFGRESGSYLTLGWWGELWGLTFLPKDQKFLTNCLNEVKEKLLNKEIKRGGGWEFYRKTQGISLKEHKIEKNFTEIDDFTQDFDFDRDYDNWSKRYNMFKEGSLPEEVVKKYKKVLEKPQ